MNPVDLYTFLVKIRLGRWGASTDLSGKEVRLCALSHLLGVGYEDCAVQVIADRRDAKERRVRQPRDA